MMITRSFVKTPALIILSLLAAVSTAGAQNTIVYKKVDNTELKLMIEKPADWKATDKRPAIVFFFGGGWVAGNAAQFRKQGRTTHHRISGRR